MRTKQAEAKQRAKKVKRRKDVQRKVITETERKNRQEHNAMVDQAVEQIMESGHLSV